MQVTVGEMVNAKNESNMFDRGYLEVQSSITPSNFF